MNKGMKEYFPFYLDSVNRYVVKQLVERYGMEPFDALRRFLASETYKMLSNPQLEMWDFPDETILDMWICEQITGNPRNLSDLRCE